MIALVQQYAFFAVAAVFLIGFLVLVHEAGHFLAAKLFGVGVPVFSIGMGPRLFGFTWRGTDYRISALPVGGYVRMAGADPFGEVDPEADDVPPEQDFSRKPVWQRLIIMAAGPAVNLLLPVVLFTMLIMLGRPELRAEVGAVLPGTPAAEAGLVPEDRVLAVDGAGVESWTELQEALAKRIGTAGDVSLTVERGGERVTVGLPAEALRRDREGLVDFVGLGWQPYYFSSRIGLDALDTPAGRAGLRTGDVVTAVDGAEVDTWHELMAALGTSGTHTVTFERREERAGEGGAAETVVTTGTAVLTLDDGVWTPRAEAWANPWGLAPVTLFAGRVEPGDPADRAGVLPDDRFLRVDGVEILSFQHFVDKVSETARPDGTTRPLELVVLRDGREITLTMKPNLRVATGEAYSRPIIGVGSYGMMAAPLDTVIKRYGFFTALPRALSETGEWIDKTLSILGNMLLGRADPRDNVGGPVAMFYVAGKVAEEGFVPFVSLMAFFSVSLGILNLLPVPVLDGGQILFYLIEAIRGRPLSLELRERFQMIGVVALFALMVLVTANDFNRVLFPGP